MTRITLRVLAAVAGVSLAGAAFATGDGYSFNRVATIANYLNNDNLEDQTVSEIVAATENGKLLVYTDSELEQLGFVWIGNPSNPFPIGKVDLPGEPTSVAVLRNWLALVAVNTSESLTNPSGKLLAINVWNRKTVAELDLAGQPDAIDISKDGRYAAVAIENERDEEICVGGEFNGGAVPEDDDDAIEACVNGGGVVGGLPQTEFGNPPGSLDIVDLVGGPKNWSVRNVDLTGLAEYAPGDPEPEFADINEHNFAAVSMQENNHLAIVDLKTGKVVNDFPMGTVDLYDIDATEDDRISLTENLFDVPREPDAIAWVGKNIVTANEGDLFGGSRGFTVFDAKGAVLYDSGNTYERLAVQHGHYPEGRSENKGTEPEAVEYGRFLGKDMIFVGSERGSFIAVYELLPNGQPRFRQLLPGPLGPEGVLAIPERNLLVVSGEEDDPEFGVRSTIMIDELGKGPADYPQILSRSYRGQPVPFGALSGMEAMPYGGLVAVWDSFYVGDPSIFNIWPDGDRARVTWKTPISGAENLDPEGIALAPDRGSFWIASEGNASGSRLNRLIQVDRMGTVLREVFLPAEIEACRQAERDLGEDEDGEPLGNIGSHGAGFEGVAILSRDDEYRVLVAQQRGWDYTTSPECEVLDDNPGDNNDPEPDYTRIWVYDPMSDTWDHIPWELAPVPERAAWSGLSEISRAGDGHYVVLERDNRTGDFAELKTLVRVSVEDALDGVSAAEKSVVDLLPALKATEGWITDKPEGVAIRDDGEVFVVTDNDGVDDWSGETWFFSLGNVDELFGGGTDE